MRFVLKPIANGFSSTRLVGWVEASAPIPITKTPAGYALDARAVVQIKRWVSPG
jgi:hypothetical protein